MALSNPFLKFSIKEGDKGRIITGKSYEACNISRVLA